MLLNCSHFKIIVLLICILTLSACMVIPAPNTVVKGKKFDPEFLSFLKPGKSTIESVLEVLGPPDSHWIDENVLLYKWSTRKAWVVAAAPYGGAGMFDILHHDFVTIKFDHDGYFERYKVDGNYYEKHYGQYMMDWVNPDYAPEYSLTGLNPNKFTKFTYSGYLLGVPTEEQTKHINTGNATLVLTRVVFANNKPREDFFGGLSQLEFNWDMLGFYQGPIDGANIMRFPSEELREQGWFYLVLPKETHYLGLRLNGPLWENATRWWKIDPQLDLSYVYAGTIVVDTYHEKDWFGISHITGVRSVKIVDETIKAREVFKVMMLDTNILFTEEMAETTGDPFVFETPQWHK